MVWAWKKLAGSEMWRTVQIWIDLGYFIYFLSLSPAFAHFMMSVENTAHIDTYLF